MTNKKTAIDIAGKAWPAVSATAKAMPENPASKHVLAAKRKDLARGCKYRVLMASNGMAALCDILDAASEMGTPIIDAGGRRGIKRIRERLSGDGDPRASQAAAGGHPAPIAMPPAKKGSKLADVLTKTPKAMLEELGENGYLITAAFRAGRFALRVVFKGGRLAYQGLDIDNHHAMDEPVVQFYDLHQRSDTREMGCSYTGMTMDLGAFMRVRLFLDLNSYVPHWRMEKPELLEAKNKLMAMLAKEKKLGPATRNWMGINK